MLMIFFSLMLVLHSYAKLFLYMLYVLYFVFFVFLVFSDPPTPLWNYNIIYFRMSRPLCFYY